MDRWESTPRLAFLSAQPESGKTRALEITELLVPNPVQAINVSPSYLFRKVGSEEGATILFDEIDTVFGPKAKENEELRGLLNAGHRRGAVAGRCVVKGKEIVPEEIPAYAAVALAGLGWLPDTILSRSVVIRMRRRHAGERVEPYRRRLHRPEGEAIREIMANWSRGAELKWPELPRGIEDRSADVWEPLIAIPDCSSHGLRKAIARRMAEAGMSPHQIQAITGHTTLKEIERYTKAARQKLMAEMAMRGLDEPVAQIEDKR
jgi:integrase